ncbi:MAG TPA: prolipoprotein diacylglyceryl transferase family protein [Propionicimonas sp.]|jgi:phosphatidylglycerol:prolipoprotein diacylglycerol transferase
MSQQRRHHRPAASTTNPAQAGLTGRPNRLPSASLAELVELAAARAAEPTSSPARRASAASSPSRPPSAARPDPIAAPRLARLAGSPQTTTGLEFVANPIGTLTDVEPQAVAVSYWFTAPAGTTRHRVSVRFTGHRLDVIGARSPGDDFVATEDVADVAPDSGPIAVTHRITGTTPGRWAVTAEALALPHGADKSALVRLPTASGTGRSVYAPIARTRAPGVVLGAWPAMVGLGFVLALLVQGLLARVHGLTEGRVVMLALLAGVLGLLGAKTYYWLTHLRERIEAATWLAGLSVQGFVAVATAVFILGGWWWGVPVGHLLDASIPALLTGQAVGRLGCLLAGCCSGLPTRSHWAIWSSDRHIGTRRVPVQLLESSSAALLALVTGLIAWQAAPERAGLLFAAGVAAYVLVRQVLFPLRGLPRATRHGRAVMLVLAPVVLAGSIAGALFA